MEFVHSEQDIVHLWQVTFAKMAALTERRYSY